MDELIPISPAAVWGGRILSGLVIVFLLFDAAIKLIPLDVVIETSRQLGIPTDISFTLGVMTLVGTLLYAYPKTSVVGAVLLTGYLGGCDLRACPCRQPAVQPHTIRRLSRGDALGRTLSS